MRFSQNYYSINYRFKKADLALNSKILTICLHGISNRENARIHFISAHCVRIRLKRLSQQALNFQARATQAHKINEAVCFDGLENFAGSQYDPNNINQALGQDSLFIYDFNFASFNRKGYTSPWQKMRLKQIESGFGRYSSKNIKISAFDLFARLQLKTPSKDHPLNLITDRHPQYARALKLLPRKPKINHLTISSKACRNFQNILFSVNHADLIIRYKLAAFTRETISFSKSAGAMCQKYALFMVHKNFMAPQFTKKHVTRPHAHDWSPAQHLNLAPNILSFSDIFAERAVRPDAALNEDWKCFWHESVPSKYMRAKLFRKR